MADKGKSVSYGNCVICGREALSKYGGGELTGIEGPDAIKLKDGQHLCGACVRKLRLLYPLQWTFDEAKRTVETKDPLWELTGDEALEADRQVVSYREDLREQYGFHNAVFIVDAMAESPGGFLKAPLVSVFGQVLYGTFYMQDEVTVISGGKEMKAPVVAVEEYQFRIPMSASTLKDRVRYYADPATHIGETGYPIQLVLQAKGIAVKAGDLIVKD